MLNRLQIPKSFNKKWVLGLVCLVVIALVGTYLYVHKKPTPDGAVSTASQNTKGEASSNGSSADKTSDTKTGASTEPGDEKSNSDTATSSTEPPLTPAGNFISNHHPNLSGSPAPNTISSVCTTSPGASCVISFTKDGATKSLEAQTTDRGGATYWNWKLQDIGLTSGSWKVTATASLNDKKVSSEDAMNLEIAQ